MTIAVFIENSSAVSLLRKNKVIDKVSTIDCQKRLVRELAPITVDNSFLGSSDHKFQKGTRRDETWILNPVKVRRCIFLLLQWEDQNFISNHECMEGVRLILTVSGFQILEKPILDRQIEKVKLILLSFKDETHA